MDEATVLEWAVAIQTDNHQFMSGEISHKEYWNRVYARDRALAEMSDEDLIAFNGALLQLLT